jgi:hypothetical protein
MGAGAALTTGGLLFKAAKDKPAPGEHKMKTAEEWKNFLSSIPPEDLPSFKRWQGSVEDLVSRLAEDFAKWDVELEEEVRRLEEEDARNDASSNGDGIST